MSLIRTPPTTEPKKICNTANVGSTRISDRFCPGFPSVEATLTNSRQGWNANTMSFDRELIAVWFYVVDDTEAETYVTAGRGRYMCSRHR